MTTCAAAWLRRHCFVCFCWDGRSPRSAVWTSAVLAIFLLPAIFASFMQLLDKASDCSLGLHLQAVGIAALRQLSQIVLSLTFLPYEGLYTLDAIIRTLFRVVVTHRRLLEWETASDVQQRARNHLGRFFSSMLMAPLLSLGTAALLMRFRPAVNLPAQPLLALWIMSPAIAWFISQPLTRHEPSLSTPQRPVAADIGPKNLAIFRNVCWRRRSSPPARQLPGIPQGTHRAPHLAYQHRPRYRLHACGLRLWLYPRRRTHRSHQQDASHNGNDEALSGSFLQLV